MGRPDAISLCASLFTDGVAMLEKHTRRATETAIGLLHVVDWQTIFFSGAKASLSFISNSDQEDLISAYNLHNESLVAFIRDADLAIFRGQNGRPFPQVVPSKQLILVFGGLFFDLAALVAALIILRRQILV